MGYRTARSCISIYCSTIKRTPYKFVELAVEVETGGGGVGDVEVGADGGVRGGEAGGKRETIRA